jgi:hypothetical protein
LRDIDLEDLIEADETVEDDGTPVIVTFKINDDFIINAVESYAKMTNQIDTMSSLRFIRMETDMEGIGIHEITCQVVKEYLN